MPMIIEPKADEKLPTKRVAPPGWDSEREWIDILAYLTIDTLERAQKAGKVTIKEGSKTREEFRVALYHVALFGAQIRGWQIQAPDDADSGLSYTQDGQRYWTFCPDVVERLPWDLRNWLDAQIQQCGGILPTRDLLTTAEDGSVLDYKSQDAGLGTQQA